MSVMTGRVPERLEKIEAWKCGTRDLVNQLPTAPRKKPLRTSRGGQFLSHDAVGLEVHSAHATHSAHAAARHRRAAGVLLGRLGNHGFRGVELAGHGGGILQRAS